MKGLSDIGRSFYGLSMAGMGMLTIVYRDFPYMFIPPKHRWIPTFITVFLGLLLFLGGLAIVFKLKSKTTAFVLGVTLLAIFFFYHVPYEFIATSSYTQFGAWENAFKELALAGGAFVVADCSTNEKLLTPYFEKLLPFGVILYSISIFSFGIDHLLYAKEAADYVPSWIPWHLFWIYFCGIALLASAAAIVVKFKVRLASTLLGSMILIWFIILHIPRVINAPTADLEGEIPSALLALAYSGIAFAIAGEPPF